MDLRAPRAKAAVAAAMAAAGPTGLACESNRQDLERVLRRACGRKGGLQRHQVSIGTATAWQVNGVPDVVTWVCGASAGLHYVHTLMLLVHTYNLPPCIPARLGFSFCCFS